MARIDLTDRARRGEVGPPPIVLATPTPLSHRTAEENLGLGYLAAVLRGAGFDVRVIDAWLEGLTTGDLVDRIRAIRDPLWVGFSCYRSNIEPAKEVVAALRRSGLDTVFVAGGYGPTFHAEDFLRAGFDVVVRGEAEHLVAEMSRRIKEGASLRALGGVSLLHGGVAIHNPPDPMRVPLDELPEPDHDTLSASLARRNPVHISTSRGCLAHCSFCSIVAFTRIANAAAWRQRSVQSVVDEIDRLHRRGVRHFKVIDDSLLEPPRDLAWCVALADALEQRGVSVLLRGSIRADRVSDSVVDALARAGFFSFSCGIENYAPSALRRMVKSASVEQNEAALSAFRRNGIYVQAGHILFDHATTMDELWANLDGMCRHPWTISKGVFTEMYAARGTPYTRLLARRQLLRQDATGLENHRYDFVHAEVGAVYDALKLWHRAHMKIYDKAIDPLSAPKALERSELAVFHELYGRLRQRDLAVFRDVLRMADSGCVTRDLLDHIEQEVRTARPWYALLDREVQAAYDRVSLVYDAVENPYVC